MLRCPRADSFDSPSRQGSHFNGPFNVRLVPHQGSMASCTPVPVPERAARKAARLLKASTVIQIENEHFVLNARDASLMAGCAKQPINMG
jgi:hypothetical protein